MLQYYVRYEATYMEKMMRADETVEKIFTFTPLLVYFFLECMMLLVFMQKSHVNIDRRSPTATPVYLYLFLMHNYTV